jgi:hypothetical protein
MKNILRITIFSFLLVLTSCEAEKDLIKNPSIVKKSNSEITFSEFKKETGLNDFKTTIKITMPKAFLARNADGSYELSDFNLDTDIIKRLQLDDKLTYSFRIYPKVIVSSNSFYNLTLENKEGTWVQNILELKPTLENFDNLLSGSTNDIFGTVNLLFTSNENVLTAPDNCYAVGIISNNCASSEISETCVSKKYGTFCFDEENTMLIGQESNIFNNYNNSDLDYSFILNTNNLKEGLNKFAENHVLLNNEIIKLLENEPNINLEGFPYEELSSSQNEEQFKQALANAGVIKYSQLGDLLLSQSRNAGDFQLKNKDFAVLKPATKQVLISNAIDTAVANHPVNWIPIDSSQTTLAEPVISNILLIGIGVIEITT